jgi:hypothetical protein
MTTNSFAFPITAEQHPNGICAEPGMTIRDYFAIRVMQSELTFSGANSNTEYGLAKWSYEMADHMLAARDAK